MGGAPAQLLQVVQRVALRLAGYKARLTVRAGIGKDLPNLGDVVQIQLCRRQLGWYGLGKRLDRHRAPRRNVSIVPGQRERVARPSPEAWEGISATATSESHAASWAGTAELPGCRYARQTAPAVAS